MKVEIREFYTEEPSKWGTVKTRCGFDMVMVNDVQAGWVPSDPNDPNALVFHPLSGFPQELVDEVIANSNLRSSLKAPKPSPVPEVDS